MRTGRFVLSGVCIALLWLASLRQAPPPDTSLDPSWQEVLVHAYGQQWQFGRDIIFTWGPWGFLNSLYHLGEIGSLPRLLWETMGSLIIAVGLVSFTRALPWWRQSAFVFACSLLNWVFLDANYIIFVTLAFTVELIPGRSGLVKTTLWLIFLALLAQLKFSYAILISAGVAVSTMLALGRREWLRAGALPLHFATASVVWWLLAGQQLESVYHFIKQSMEVAGGYGGAMGLKEDRKILLSGIALLVIAAIVLIFAVLPRQHRWLRISQCFFVAAAWYLSWKHGYTRADGHVLGFYLFALHVTLAVNPALFTDCRLRWSDLALPISLLGFQWQQPGLLMDCLRQSPQRLTQQIHRATEISSWRAQWHHLGTMAPANAHLPKIRTAVGTASVDVFSYEQGFALLNQLNYQPRPIFQSYSAYTPKLLRKNLRHYTSGHAPDYIIWHHLSIDGRLAAQDDSLLIPEIARAYAPVLEENSLLLLKRQSDFPKEPGTHLLVSQRTLPFDETWDISEAKDKALWVQLSLRPTVAGRLVAAAYKPPIIQIEANLTDGTTSLWRLIPAVAEAGFVLNPVLETPADFASFFRGEGVRWIKAIRLVADGNTASLWQTPEVRLFELAGPKIRPLSQADALVRNGISKVAPHALRLPGNSEIHLIDGRPCLQLHPPAEIEFKVPAGATAFSFKIGMRPGAYSNPGASDGVDFIVESISDDGVVTEIHRRALRPKVNQNDQPLHDIAIAIPSPAPCLIRVRTTAGPASDLSWDWACATDFVFSP